MFSLTLVRSSIIAFVSPSLPMSTPNAVLGNANALHFLTPVTERRISSSLFIFTSNERKVTVDVLDVPLQELDGVGMVGG